MFFGVDDLDAVGVDGVNRSLSPIRSGIMGNQRANSQSAVIVTQGFAGVGRMVQLDVIGRAHRHHFTTRVTAFRAEVDEPVTGTNHIQVVLNHDQGVACVEQLAHGAHQLGDVIKVQASGGLIKHEQSATPGHTLFAGGRVFGSLGQITSQLQALGFPSRQRGHRLAELDVLQPYVNDGLQGTNHVTVTLKHQGRFADREIQHIGHIERHQAGILG